MQLPLVYRLVLPGVLAGMAGIGVGRAQAQPADAPEGVAEPARRRVAVLIVAASAEVAPEMADGLGELLVGAVAARGGVTIIGKEELQAQLAQSEEGTLECVGSMACLGRVGVQLDVVEVIAGTLARRDARWTFNLNRVDVPRGEIVGRVFREVEGDLGAVADALHAAIPELYAAPAPEQVPPAPVDPSPARLSLRTPVDGAEVTVDGALVGHTRDGGLTHELPPGAFEVRVGAPGYRVWRRRVRLAAAREVAIAVHLEEAYEEAVSPLLFASAGLAAVAFGVGLALGVHSQSSLELTYAQRRSGEVRRADVLDFYAAREHEAIAANVLFAVAGVAAVGAIVALFFPERRRASGPVALDVGPGGLALRGRF
ncbi:MAG: PEGA domain-containing protein [Sandaracinaceae bacterium]|nr:PEGA domain-containing protein [Sandaracinaceae bacterium]